MHRCVPAFQSFCCRDNTSPSFALTLTFLLIPTATSPVKGDRRINLYHSIVARAIREDSSKVREKNKTFEKRNLRNYIKYDKDKVV